MKKLNLVCCLSALVLSFAAVSCSSDEPTTKGGAKGQPGSKVAFSTKVSLDGNTKKIYLGTNNGTVIQVWWGNNDQVKIYTTTGGESGQMGVYKTSSSQSGTSSAQLEHVSDDEIVWGDGGLQSFYSVFAPEDDEGITYGSIDASGVKSLTIPAVQTGAQANENGSSPYAVAFGSVIDVPKGDNVDLSYTLVPGIIRLTIPAGDQINKVMFSSAGVQLSGTISYTNDADAATANVTNPANIITVNKTINSGGTSGPGTTPVDVYILPKALDYLAITVSGPTGSCTKTVSTPIAAGAVTDISFGGSYTMGKMDLGLRVISSVDQSTGAVTTLWAGTADAIAANGNDASGIDGDGNTKLISAVGGSKTYADAKPLYFATGNLIATMGNGNEQAPTGYRIANQAAGDYLAYMINSVTKMDGYTVTEMSPNDPECDLFKVGQISGNNYWTIDEDCPGMGPYDATTTPNFAGDPAYDIASYASKYGGLGGKWRMPTAAELAVLAQQVAYGVTRTSYYWSQGNNGAGLANFVNYDDEGFLIRSKVQGFTSASIFIPATGYSEGAVTYNREAPCIKIQSGTLSDWNYPYHLLFSAFVWHLEHQASVCRFSVRPVSE